jgi:hypothetical protein
VWRVTPGSTTGVRLLEKAPAVQATLLPSNKARPAGPTRGKSNAVPGGAGRNEVGRAVARRMGHFLRGFYLGIGCVT